MSTKKVAAPAALPSATAPTPRAMLGAVDPLALLNVLETQYEDSGVGADASAYRRLYAECLATFLYREGGTAAVNFAALLEECEAATSVETAMRHAGFIVGFECCRRLILGELDVAALTGGAK